MNIAGKIFDLNSPNNRYKYDEEVFKDAVERFNERPTKHVISKSDEITSEFNFLDIVGKVNHINCNTFGETWANIELFDTDKGKMVMNLLEKNSVRFAPQGYGEIDEDNKVIKYTLNCINVVPKIN